MRIPVKSVAIVGGGPGGLTLARLLQLRGLTVRVYERDASPTARVQGAPLDMHADSGAAALRAAGLVAEFERRIRPGAHKKRLVTKDATIAFSDHDAPASTEVAPPEIDRGALRQLFLEALAPGTVVWNRQFVALESQGAGWQLHFKNGASAYADLVVGADSANSKIRPYLTASRPAYTGLTMLEVTVPAARITAPRLWGLLNGGKVMAFGDGKCLLGGQKGDGELGFYASFRAPADWAAASGLDFANRAQLLAWFHQEYAGWSNLWDELWLGATPPAVPRPLYCAPPAQAWPTHPNLTLLGDAAHVMPPFAGEGANMAMLDALRLADCLTTGAYPTLGAALAAYEAEMRPRAAQAAQLSLANGERMHRPGALENMLTLFGKA